MAEPARNINPNDRTRHVRRSGRLEGNESVYSYDPNRRFRGPRTRKVETTTPTVTQAGSAPTISERFTQEQYVDAGIQAKGLVGPDVQAPNQQTIDSTRGAAVEYYPEPEYEEDFVPAQSIKLKKKGPSAAKVALGRTRAFAVNTGIYAWAFPLWLTFQVPLAMMSLIFLGMAITIRTFFSKNVSENTEGGFLVQITDLFSKVVKTLFEGLNVVSKAIFHIDLTILDPLNFYFILQTVLWGYGVILLLTIYLIYKFAFLNPLSGNKSSAKWGWLALAVIGYAVPLVSLFPCFFAWTIAVFKDPK
ncbi:MAG: hypothetical protein KC877_01135 [Candidatus Kaiserbacteria bacterium]|nr:hypothetical protein [Candidatus Kaiserbacteria bacterium]MCB9816507.1 hypothetical protein [Candidatus Nomurabacteria bacterium]